MKNATVNARDARAPEGTHGDGEDGETKARDVTDAGSIHDRAEALRVFASRPGPRLLAAVAGGAWLVRAALGRPRAADVSAVAIAITVWPFQEWLAHKHLLHHEPRTFAGIRIDPDFARRHRAHHAEPRDVDKTLLPLGVIVGALPIAAGLWRLAHGPRREAVTALAAYSTMALFYEWTHFIVHTNVRPTTRYGQKVRRNHHLHHFRNEAYWLGFTLPLVDRWLGTDPEPGEVPRSRVAQDVG